MYELTISPGQLAQKIVSFGSRHDDTFFECTRNADTQSLATHLSYLGPLYGYKCKMDAIETQTKDKFQQRLVCGTCHKPLEFDREDPVTDLLFRSSRCICLESDLEKANALASEASDAATANPQAPTVTLSDVQTILGEQFEVISVLGVGGMGSVYKVRDKTLDKILAVKILSEQLVQDQTSLRRFRQEALAAQALTHANLGAVYGHGIGTSGAPYIVMDCLDGKDLTTLLNQQGPFNAQRALLIFIQLAEAIDHAHAKGVVHRDLKPSNIIIENHDQAEIAKIIDFGIAKIKNADSRPTQQLTQTGEIFGSPLYMAPEQCIGNEQDARTDIYSLGCVMYEVLTGEPPFVADNAMKTVLKHIYDEPVPPSKKAVGKIPEDLDKVILHCLEKQPGDRYQTASSLASDLQKVLEERVVQISRPSIRIAARAQRKRVVKQIGMTFAISLVLAGGMFYFFNDPYANKTAHEIEIEGYMQENGADNKKDYAKALKLYRLASKKGDTDGLVSEALLYETGKGVAQDFKKAFELNQKGAELGNPLAMHNLALMYENGEGVPIDYKKAMFWYQKAAALNNHSSETNIGALYANGYGVPQNYAKAFAWTSSGANGGIPKAEYLMGLHYHYGLGVTKDLKKAISWYTRAFQHGEVNALNGLGDLYGHSKPPDFDQAFQYYERASELGDAAATVNLGLLYESGLGTKKDLKKAFELYTTAANMNDTGAYRQLARLYRDGIYVKKDANTSRTWTERLEQAQHESNAKSGEASYQGSSLRSQTKAHEWFENTRKESSDPK